MSLGVSIRARAVGALLSIWLSVAIPSVVLACPTCYASAGERVITSYVRSAALLTLLPFSIVGAGVGIALYLRRQARLAESPTSETPA